MRASSLFNKNDMYSQFSSVVRSTGGTHRVSQGWQAGQTGGKQTGRAVPPLASLPRLWRWGEAEGPGQAGEVEAAHLAQTSQGAGEQGQLGLDLPAGSRGVGLQLQLVRSLLQGDDPGLTPVEVPQQLQELVVFPLQDRPRHTQVHGLCLAYGGRG